MHGMKCIVYREEEVGGGFGGGKGCESENATAAVTNSRQMPTKRYAILVLLRFHRKVKIRAG